MPLCSTSFLGALLFFSTLSPQINPYNTMVAPNDPRIQYIGRWANNDSLVKFAEWQGSSIRVNIQGTGLSAILDGGTETEYVRVIINDDVHTTRKIPITPGTSTYTLASSLPPGDYKIELVKETYNGQNTAFSGFVLEEESTLLPPPTHPSRFISFYGDSNLAGYSLESEHNEYDHALRGSHFGLAGITSRMFDAAYHNISISGARISSLHAVFDLFSHRQPASTLDVTQYNPDAIVVNLGANDVGKPKMEIKQDYHRFLDTLRVIHPSAHIVLFNAWGWDYDEPANFTHEVVAEREDPDLTSVTFPWLFETWHGCEYDHAGMAAVLATHLEKVLGWTPKPTDVMSGYGEGGDVANGGSTQDRAQIKIDFRDQKMWTPPLKSDSLLVKLTPHWAQYSMKVRAPAEGARPVFQTRLTIGPADQTSRVDVDDISMSVLTP